MFQYIEYYSGRNKRGCKLIDSDFEVDIEIPPLAVYNIYIMLMVAKEYENRSLNAPANLALYYNRIMTNNRYWSLDASIQANTERWPEASKEFYGKYLSDIKKYMLLL